MEKLKKSKTILRLAMAGVVVALSPLLWAFEAHVINVSAHIESELDAIAHGPNLDFGTVFPQEALDQTFEITLSQSFQNDPQFDLLQYRIWQEPKCWNGNAETPVFGEVTQVGNPPAFQCVDQGFTMLPLLCPYLSKSEITEDPDSQFPENDSPGILAFHGVIDEALWTPAVASSTEVDGELQKTIQDASDIWNIDLKVPCFFGECAQDWASFVASVNPQANADDYVQPNENEHKLFGCNIRVLVTGKPPSVGCRGKLDLMLVLDRSGSINSTELTQLKNAANSFITALAPSVNGVHTGQSSFATNATLNLHLTDNEAAAHAAINALVAGGNTNLAGG